MAVAIEKLRFRFLELLLCRERRAQKGHHVADFPMTFRQVCVVEDELNSRMLLSVGVLLVRKVFFYLVVPECFCGVRFRLHHMGHKADGAEGNKEGCNNP